MFYRIFLLLGALLPFSVVAQLTRFEVSGGTETATYVETVNYYGELSSKYSTITMQEVGPTDTRYPLQVVYYSADGQFSIGGWKRQGKLILLINNGIHPGEPDGIEACKMLLRDAASGKVKVPDNVVLAVIPTFNIGGALNRNSHSRANQLGPTEYGFRGSAQNLDLNRDFIKLDAKETQSLIKLFHTLDPDVFIDNHVSNGADYQHVMTLLATQHDKLGGRTGKFMHETFEPLLYKDMKIKGYDLVPYVNHFGHTPEDGWTEFYDYPRFSSGIAALFQTIAFVPETHMLKPFKQRVEATYALMLSFIKIGAEQAERIKHAKSADRFALQRRNTFYLDWKVDTAKYDLVEFKGYEAGHKESKVSGLPRLYYDRDKPFTREVKYRNTYNGVQEVTAPTAYVIPQGWGDVLQRLKANGVQMTVLERDTTMDLSAYKIDKYETVPGPYEKHYYHKNVVVTKERRNIKLQEGDCIIYLNQPAKRYLVETLEPTGPDAFFAWNFFDAVLQQKEYFSDYVFEDDAARILAQNPKLEAELKAKQKSDTAFANSAAAQLDFVYKHSEFYEPIHLGYPVYRLE